MNRHVGNSTRRDVVVSFSVPITCSVPPVVVWQLIATVTLPVQSVVASRENVTKSGIPDPWFVDLSFRSNSEQVVSSESTSHKRNTAEEKEPLVDSAPLTRSPSAAYAV